MEGNLTGNASVPYNFTDEEEYLLITGLWKQPLHLILIYSFAYSVVFTLAVVGNSLVVSVVYKNPRMHTVTNYFIVNLAIADMLVSVIVLPITLLSNLMYGWRFGAVTCKVIPYLQGTVVSASVNTLAAIAVDRYLAICHTLKCKVSRGTAKFVILFIWMISAIIMIPWALFYQHKSVQIKNVTLYYCAEIWKNEEDKKSFFLGAIFLTCYTIPLILITVCYSLIGLKVWNRDPPGVHTRNGVVYRSKIKVVKMLLVVVILFAFSWLPLYAIRVRIFFGPEFDKYTSDIVLNILNPICQWLGSSNCCVNPLVYCFFSKKYRRGFKIVTMCCRRVKFTELQRGNSSTVYQTMPDVVNGNAQESLVIRQNQFPVRSKLTRRSTNMTAV
ncbi:neuropeptide SIFamide receptor-like [Lineus longissimus]|uniref:neuropeptide SIFamide receptor-like n=1 Tax=Lineus longissimus TaxID=88925 RepID=UPI00315C526A